MSGQIFVPFFSSKLSGLLFEKKGRSEATQPVMAIICITLSHCQLLGEQLAEGLLNFLLPGFLSIVSSFSNIIAALSSSVNPGVRFPHIRVVLYVVPKMRMSVLLLTKMPDW